MAKKAQYHPAWCADHEKVYFSQSKDQFLRSKCFRHKLRLKNLFKIGKYNLVKTVEYDSASCADHEKLYSCPWKKSIVKIDIFSSEIVVKKESLKLENTVG